MAAIIPTQHYELDFFKESTVSQYLSKTLATVTIDHFFNTLLLRQMEHKMQKKSIS